MIKNTAINLDSIVTQSEGNIVSDMDGEKVMLSINNGKYYNLGEIGGAIWDLMEGHASVKQLVAILMDKYQVDEMECEEHVMLFLTHLEVEGLIRVS
ncbi:lasso peptide biosynthesis PqqD family chaperone [Cytobacillus suaedae]|nr:lasso peptide biosynthesis PqqD family chaperone [Cytobacillus suaedae]